MQKLIPITIFPFIFLTLLFLEGCSRPLPLTAMLELQQREMAGGVYNNGETATITGFDRRPGTAIIRYQLGHRVDEELDNQTPPHQILTDQLSRGFSDQGLLSSRQAPVQIRIDLTELLVTVSRVKLFHRAKARSRLTLTVKNKGVTFTKNFDRETSRDSLTNPAVDYLEKMLHQQLTEIVSQILLDQEIQQVIKKF